jgi:hypothetical protein
MSDITVDSIMTEMEERVARGIPMTPGIYLDYAQKLVALLSNLDESLVLAEMAYRKLRAQFIEIGTTAAEAEVRAKSSDAYKEYLFLKAKRDRVQEVVNISKKRVGLTQFEQ